MKIRPVGGGSFDAEGRTDGKTDRHEAKSHLYKFIYGLLNKVTRRGEHRMISELETRRESVTA